MAIDDTRPTLTTRGLPGATPGMNAIDWIALVLMIVGGVNWGLVGLFGIDLVASIFGSMTIVSRAVYALVGLAAVYGIVLAIKQGSRSSAAMA
jgi:uncharacterized protein